MPSLIPPTTDESRRRLLLRGTAEPLTSEEMRRYNRQILLSEVGIAGQQRLKNSRVLVIGAGGLGSVLLMTLAAAGVGTIGIVDTDTVDLSNLARQIVHRTGTVGRSKVASAADTLRDLNPHTHVIEHTQHFDNESALALGADYDVVVDGTDNFAVHFAAADATEALGIPLVWGSVLRYDGMYSVFWPASGDSAPGFRDLFPDENAAVDDDAETCETVGVLGTSCAIVAASMASEVIKLVVGTIPTVSGRVLVLDAKSATWREIPLIGGARDTPASRAARVEKRPEPVPAVREVSADQLADTLQNSAQHPVTLVDVREVDEFVVSSIPGATNLPLSELRANGVPSSLDRAHPVVLYCEIGKRSLSAGRMLAEAGFDSVTSLSGGIRSWTRAGYPPANGGSTSS